MNGKTAKGLKDKLKNAAMANTPEVPGPQPLLVLPETTEVVNPGTPAFLRSSSEAADENQLEGEEKTYLQ